MRPTHAVTLALALGALSACTSADEAATGQPPPTRAFARSTRRIVLEVDYAANADPYVGAAGPFDDVWRVTKENLAALFASAPELVVPTTLAEMERIDAPAGPYASKDVVAIAEAHRDQWSAGSEVTFYAVWLDGYYRTDKGIDDAVLGAALPDYGVIALFKPAIRAVDLPRLPAVVRFTEQTALVHELGHVLGLVDVGLPPVSDHEDPSHPGHCDNAQCVMYWANEGAGDLVEFVNRFLSTGSEIVFDDACLADAHAAAE